MRATGVRKQSQGLLEFQRWQRGGWWCWGPKEGMHWAGVEQPLSVVGPQAV